MATSKLTKFAEVTALVLATLLLLGCWLVIKGVLSFYQPNLMLGLFGLRYGSAFAALLIVNVIWFLISRFVDEGHNFAFRIGTHIAVLLAVAVAFLGSNLIVTDARVSYYVGDRHYQIPWRYRPINGASEPGGEYFVIHVKHPGFTPGGGGVAAAGTRHWKLSIHRPSRRIYGDELVSLCRRQNPCLELGTRPSVHFEHGGMHYRVGGSGDPLAFSSAQDIDDFKGEVVSLFESFRN